MNQATPWKLCEGQMIYSYRLRRLLGTGGFGAVFLAEELVASRVLRTVAVKLISPNDELGADRQFRELELAVTLQHEHILRSFAAGACQVAGTEMFYLVMELAEESLDARMRREPCAPDETRRIVRTLATALAYMHAEPRRLVHRDIKPQNLLRVGAGWKLGDFGITRGLEATSLARSGVQGTFAYMPPEGFSGEVSTAWDIWSLGVLAQQLLCGQLPYDVETLPKFMYAVRNTPPRIAALPAPFDTLVRQCLQKAWHQRPTAEEVLLLLDEPAASPPAECPPPTDRPAPCVVVALYGGHFTRISEAVARSAPGTRILVRPGTYRDSLLLDKDIEIIADGPQDQVVLESSTAACLNVTGGSAVVRGLTLRGRFTPQHKQFAVDVTAGQLTLEDCTITSNALACVGIHGPQAALQASRCLVHDGAQCGVLCYEQGHAVLDNCEITRNQLAGVEIREGGEATLRHCLIHDGGAGGLLVHLGGQGRAEDCNIYANRFAGVEIKHDGNPLLLRCTIHDSKEGGVLVYEQGRGQFESCAIYGNALSGIEIRSGGNPALRQCVVRDGLQSGVYVHERGLGTLDECEIYGNRLSGIEIKDHGNPRVRRCILRNGQQGGVYVHQRGQGIIERCDVFANTLSGILVKAQGNPVIRQCTVHDNVEGGIKFYEHALGRAEDCDISGNLLGGIICSEGSMPAVLRCRIHHGRQGGIFCFSRGQGTFEECDVFENAYSGLSCKHGGAPTIHGCRITRNHHFGVSLADGGGGRIEDCDLTGNAHGPWNIGPNCIVHRANNQE